MLKRTRMLAVLVLFAAVAPATGLAEGNCLELGIHRIDTGGVITYDIALYADKVDAVSCTITTPHGSYDCHSISYGWFPSQDYYPPHTGMTLSELTDVVAPDWIITFDAGLPTETIASIPLGPVSVGDFLVTPIITHPQHGAAVDPDHPTMTWTYGGVDLCATAVETIVAYLRIPDFVVANAPPLDCDDLEWTIGEVLPDWAWTFGVQVGYASAVAPGGHVGTVLGDPWVLDHEDWRMLYSLGRVDFTTTLVATTPMGLGEVKRLYR